MTPAEISAKQRQLVATEFLRIFQLRHRVDAAPVVYEAPAAESWVVIINGEAWVSASGDGLDTEDFVFWGPLGKKSIAFPLLNGWPT